MRRPVALAALAAAAATPIATAEIAEDVTIGVRIRDDPSASARYLEIAGTVGNRAAGERVEVQAKECGFDRFYRLIGAATTVSGGTWRVVTGVDVPPVPTNSYFRARWRGKYSKPVLLRIPAIVDVRWNPRRRLARAAVDPWLTGLNFQGRLIELQRRIPGTDQWVLVRRARLVRTRRTGFRLPPGFASVFSANFVVPTRGLELRVRAPAATGAPCFSAGVSETWRS
jgi:hypothetical protein